MLVFSQNKKQKTPRRTDGSLRGSDAYFDAGGAAAAATN
jgi:hypothetical protein